MATDEQGQQTSNFRSNEQQDGLEDRGAAEREDQSSHQQELPKNAMLGMKAAQLAKAYLVELAGKQAETVTGLMRGEHGWTVQVEVVESARIPDTSDVLGSYRVELDDAGELIEYQRTRRYFRNQAGDD